MKKVFFCFMFLVAAASLNAQTNLLIDGGFENYKPGPCSFTTISGGKISGLSGKWQMSFAKGGCPDGCAKGSAAIVTSDKKAGNNSIEIKVDSQVNRNDIKLLQTIAGTQTTGEYEVSFWIKASVISPVAIDLLRGTQQNTNNGALPFTGSFTATTEWQQFKFTTNISDWTDADRTDMRVSIRVNNNKSLPIGPYPKTFWIDEVAILKK
ncbi:MAG: carbohydrate binding domain-containing protein [Chitinophagaceae bacterium]